MGRRTKALGLVTSERAGQYLRLKALATASIAERAAHECLDPLFCKLTVRFLEQPLQIGKHPLKWLHAWFRAAAEIEFNLLLAGAVQNHLTKIFRQIFPRQIHRLAVMRRYCANDMIVIDDHAPAAAFPRSDGAIFQRLFGIGHNQLLIEHQLLTKPMAGAAGAKG